MQSLHTAGRAGCEVTVPRGHSVGRVENVTDATSGPVTVVTPPARGHADSSSLRTTQPEAYRLNV